MVIASPPGGSFFTNPSIAALSCGNLLASLRISDGRMILASFWGWVRYAKDVHTGIELVRLDRFLHFATVFWLIP